MAASVNFLDQAFRNAVASGDKPGHLEELTVKRLRRAVEEMLNLREGFFKEPAWKDKSKQIIEDEAVCLQHLRCFGAAI